MATHCDGEACCLGGDTLTDLFNLLGRRYALEVVCVIWSHEPARFGVIEDHLPEASTSTLSARLDDLETAGVLTRERYDEIPPRVEYSLTAEGSELGERLEPIVEWAQEREKRSGGESG